MCVFLLGDAAILEAKFYVIGFEYMLEVVKSEDDIEHMPVEVGIVEWSMRTGISREFHRLINPGQFTSSIVDSVKIKDVKFSNSNFVSKIRILFELCLGLR